MKTRDRILATSLLLFNEEGEPNVTTVDISNEMNISPGNLYYHFKGKEAIIEELFADFEREISSILNAPLQKALSVEDSWFYLYVVFEEIYNFRFFYQNLTNILHRYDSINRRFKRLMQLKSRTVEVLLVAVKEHGILEIAPAEMQQLRDSITLTLTYWLTYSDLKGQHYSPPVSIHKGVFQIVHLMVPYLTEEYAHVYRECKALYEQAMAELDVTCPT
jgi:AcrR family transcriptional regulator